jgi:CheY-like chemotaxis protein
MTTINVLFLTGNFLFLLLLQTWWYQLLVLFFAAAGAVVFYKIQITKIKRQKADLERKVHERSELLSYAKLNEQKACSEAELLNKNKKLLLSKISHEIRTPMNAVMGMAALLNETALNTEQREYAATILNSGDGLLTVINDILMNDILEYSKVEAGNALEAKPFDLHNCIEEVLDVFAAKAAEANLDLVYNIDDNVPPQIVGDAFRVRQILMNLVENAFRFTKKGEIFVAVRSLQHQGDNRLKLEFEVGDTGTGMTPARLAQVANDLSKPETFAETNVCIGTTLIICKRLVSLMEGSIKAESREKEGTTFKFTIWTRSSAQALNPHPHLELAGLAGKKILVADDNATVRFLLKTLLIQWKLTPVLAESGKEALEILTRDNTFNLVITDFQMPEMDGIELAQQIKQQHKDLPIILLNKAGDESFRHYPALFSSVLNKPLRHHILSNQIFSGLRQKDNSLVQDEQNYKQKLSVDFSKQYPLNILIAEDDKLNQKLALKILNKLGYDPQIANNGQEVLELVSQRNYDVILMDVQMPIMNGLEATKMIRVCLAEQPFIVAMTANSLQGDREECILAGMDDYISKPIHLKELVIILEKYAMQVSRL